MTTQGSTFVTTLRSDSKYIGWNRARKFRNPKFHRLIREVWVVFIVIHHYGEVPGIERNKTHIFSGHGVAEIEKSSRVFLPPIGLFLVPCCIRCGSNRATRPPQGGGGEWNWGGPASGGGWRTKNGSGSGLGFFETGQLLPTNISLGKVTETFTDEIFVGKGYS